jgi:Carbohydrate family 9 binding domain-like
MVSASSFRTSVAASATVLLGSSTSHSNMLPHWKLYPKSYTVSKLAPSASSTNAPAVNHDKPYPSPSFVIDGNIDKDIWKDIPWSDVFGDIQGSDDGPTNVSIPITRFKATYDEAYLYIAGELYPAEGMTTQAHYTQRNSPIYQQDSDFEVFIDVDHSNHMYKELEVNAINTIWNLLLDMPYEDGGHEHSGRIARPGEPNFYEVYHQATSTKVIAGRINDPDNCTGAAWTVEMALSFADLLSNTTMANDKTKYSPAGGFWRINFSRVEKRGVINWTWQPQVRWNPVFLRYGGFVQMHMPDAWGYLYFVPDSSSPPGDVTPMVSTPTEQHIERDPLWPAKLTAMTVYYALQEYKRSHAKFTDVLSDLSLPIEIIEPFQVDIQLHARAFETEEGFVVIVAARIPLEGNDAIQIQVYDDRLMKIIHASSTNLSSLSSE